MVGIIYHAKFFNDPNVNKFMTTLSFRWVIEFL